MSELTQEYNISTTFDFEQILNPVRFCDCTIIVGGTEFRSHRVLLAGCSSYFACFFFSDSVTVCELKDYCPIAFQQFLNFLYTKKVTVTPDSLPALIRIAYYLEIKTLFDVVAEFLDQVASYRSALGLLKGSSFALTKLQGFRKYISSMIEKLGLETDFSFMDIQDFKFLIKSSRFKNQYQREELIQKYCLGKGINTDDFAEFKLFDPALPDESMHRTSFSAIVLSSPPDNGLFQLLSNQMGVSASGSLNGRDPKTVIQENPIRHWFTESDGNAWVLFEFKELYVQPTHYAIWSHGGSSTLRNWAFQASNDRSNWVVLSTHRDDEGVREPFSNKMWSIDTKGFFKYFRIIQTGSNWSGNRWLYLLRVEMWGVACSKDNA